LQARLKAAASFWEAMMIVPSGALAGVRGPVLRPGDLGYERARRVFNGLVDRRPAVIVRPADADDVAIALAYAGQEELPITVRGSGYGFDGAAIGENALTLDMRSLDTVTVDPGARTARVGAGVTWGALDAAAQAHGLAVTGAWMSTLGVVGCALGRGAGWLEPTLGPTGTHIRSATLFDPSGEVVEAGPEGLEGGVITELELGLAPLGPRVLGGFMLYDGARAADVIEAYVASVSGAPELTGGLVLLEAPHFDWIPARLRGRFIVAIVVLHPGDPSSADHALRPLRRVRAAADLVRPTTYIAVQSLLDDLYPPGLLATGASGELAAVDRDARRALVRGAKAAPSLFNTVLLRPVSAGRWAVEVLALWTDPRETTAQRDWARGVVASVGA
jgi:FAD/FMN-containing dehydrogenase